MPEVHRLAKGVCGITGLTIPLQGLSVNAGFVVESKTVIHIDAGLTNARAQSRQLPRRMVH